MSLFLIAAAALTVVVLALVLLPLLRDGAPAPERAAFDRAVYRDQLRELERDEARGMIGTAEAATARLEIQRRLLGRTAGAAVRPAPPPIDPARSARSPALALALALLLAGSAGSVYMAAGRPELPGQPLAQRVLDPEEVQLRLAVAELGRKVTDEPRNGEAWLLLARASAALGQWTDAVEAYREALALVPATPEIRAAALEATVLAAGGVVAPASQEGFEGVLAEEPANPIARFYLAAAHAQAGRHDAAIAGWQALAADLPAGVSIRDEVARRVAASARAAGIAAPPIPPPAEPPDQAAREEMIRGMVARLAARLEEEPDDADGWQRLGRAYSVMGEQEKAVQAYARAGALRPDDMAIALAEAQTMLEGLAPTAPFPPRALDMLRRVAAADPRQPAALWHLGVEAAKRGAMAEAVGYWDRLLALLPPDSDDARMVRAAVDAVKRR